MVPRNGMNYGVLRYLANDLDMRERLADAPARELLFNYLGQWDQSLGKDSSFQFARPIAGEFGRQGSRPYVIEINAVIFAGRLLVDWTYSENLHTQASIESLADKFLVELQDLISHCATSTTPGFTPSDFPDADLDQEALDELLAGFDESLA
jgi:non-ribosomal peptide synthase protein (TIGR01720 family)